MEVTEPNLGDIMTRISYLNDLGLRTTSYFHTEDNNWRTFAQSLIEKGTAFTMSHASEAEVDRVLDCFFTGMAEITRELDSDGGE